MLFWDNHEILKMYLIIYILGFGLNIETISATQFSKESDGTERKSFSTEEPVFLITRGDATIVPTISNENDQSSVEDLSWYSSKGRSQKEDPKQEYAYHRSGRLGYFPISNTATLETLAERKYRIWSDVFFRTDTKNVIGKEITRKRRSVEKPLEVNSQSVAYSQWGKWMPCVAVTCGVVGKQMRTRTCYSLSISTEDKAVCSYQNLVDTRECVGKPCANKSTAEISKTRWSPWSLWSECTVTCGSGGKQKRRRKCMTPVDGESPSTKCTQKESQERFCRYSFSCPDWDQWTRWSTCSKTCGKAGVKFRTRNCILERYLHSLSEDAYGDSEYFTDETGRNSNISSEFVSGQDDFIQKDRNIVFVVDEQTSSEEMQMNSIKEVIDVEDGISVKEIVSSELCSDKAGDFEQQVKCDDIKSCPPKWQPWQQWSPCSSTCGSGIGKRERKCIRGVTGKQCIGRRYVYRRCYSPPCWSAWKITTECSARCGPGYIVRKRKCLMVLPAHPQYKSCVGNSTERVECHLTSCRGDAWSKWSGWSDCTVTCDGGLKHRNRTCAGVKCFGESKELAKCNEQVCPTWSQWQPFTCCNVSCGQGFRRRTRVCRYVDEAGGCMGKTVDVEFCYRKPCSGSSSGIPLFSNQQCGRRPWTNLKNTVKLRIFGGKTATPHDWPWQASWQHRSNLDANWTHFCGGIVIHPRWVVTAGHCIEEAPYYVDQVDPGDIWSVVLGMHKLNNDGTRFFIERVFVHPGYQRRAVTRNDIALLKLRRMTPMNDKISRVCMPGSNRPKPGESCFITGWGHTEPEGTHAKSLMQSTVPIMDFEDCRGLGDYYRYFLNSTLHMCAGDPNTASSDSCTGDSGGPLVCKNGDRWYFAAVTSFGFADCGTPGHVGIYTPVNTHESWIRSVVRGHTYEKC